MKPGLLVSVRGAAEAETAIASGAGLVDVKEPANGPLGRASLAVIGEVLRTAAGRVPVSAALGELSQEIDEPIPDGLSFVKWGLAGCGQNPDWPRRLLAANCRVRAAAPSCRVVAVAYADWERSEAPPVLRVVEVARENGLGLLIDTWGKDGTTLLNWMSVDGASALCRAMQAAGLPVALAGALGETEIAILGEAQPDWFAVRGSACAGGRGGTIDRTRVRRLARAVRATTPAVRS